MTARYSELAGRRVLVTGAGSGVGLALVERLLDQEAIVYATDRATAALAPRSGLQVIEVDLSETASWTAILRQVEAEGGLDVLVNNAAAFVGVGFEALTPEQFDYAIAVNLRAAVFLAQGCLRGMAARGGGAIVNVASVAVRTGGARDVLAYAASKGGLVTATKTLAKLAAPQRIRVNAVLPAAIDTPMLRRGFSEEEIARVVAAVPLGRLSQPAEIAAAVLWLASDEASYVTGACLDVNGGWVMP